MVFRKAGTLLPLERSILEVGVRRGPRGMYGFWLAQHLAADEGTNLVAHGTLYKALDRMRRAGLLEAEWEDPHLAAEAGRPRRRVYTVTAAGARALKVVDAQPAVRPRPGEVTT
jgi:PadR family transcriptional regulator PadR